MENDHEKLVADYQAIIEKLNGTFDEKKLIPPIKEMTDVLFKDLKMLVENTNLLIDQVSLPIEKGGLKKFHQNNNLLNKKAIPFFNDEFAMEFLPEIFDSEYEAPLNNVNLLVGHMYHLWQFLTVTMNELRIQTGEELLLRAYIALLKIKTASMGLVSQLIKTNKDLADAIQRNKGVKAKRNPQKDYCMELANKYQTGGNSCRAKNIFNEWDRNHKADKKGTPKPYSEDYIRKLLGQS